MKYNFILNFGYAPSDYGISKNDEDIQEEMRDMLDISPLFRELQNAGWSTSSMRC